MSHPIIGNENEVNGDFFLEFHPPEIELKNGKSFYIIKPNIESFEIENSYFKKLFDQKKIIISWQVYSSKTFFQKSSTNFDEVRFSTEKISGPFEVSFFLCANVDFVFDPPKDSVNSFFSVKTKVDKGCILSRQTKFRITPNIVDKGGISSILEFVYKKDLDDEYVVDFYSHTGRIVVYLRDKSFYNVLNSLTSKKLTKKIAINSFFSSIIVRAIMLLGNDDEEFLWSDDLKAIIEFDDEMKESYKDFNKALNIYDEKFDEDGFLKNSIIEINKLIE